MDASTFLASLYGARELPAWLVLWDKKSKKCVWTKSVDDVAAYVESVNKKNVDSYFHVCLQQDQLAAGKRGTIENVAVVPGVWADLDFGDKPNLPEASKLKNYPDRASAMKALEAMPAKVSFLLATGGGVHAYWLFDRPFVVTDEASRNRVAAVSKAWQGLLKARLLKLGGFGIDSTFDLARILRIPGTVHTSHPGRLVTVEAATGLRYPFEAIEGWITGGVPSILPASTAKSSASAGTVATTPPAASDKPAARSAVDPGASYATEMSEPPAFRLGNLMQASPEFRRLWDGKIKKPSPSEYDMSLANYFVNAGWSDQEAAAGLVAFAREHQSAHLQKLLRVTNGVQDYLKLTLEKAHVKRYDAGNTAASEKAVDDLAHAVRQAERKQEEVDRSLVLEKVSAAFGVKVVGFRQTGRREEVYSMLISQFEKIIEVSIGGAAAIHGGPQRLCERLLAECGKMIVVSKKLKQEWPSILTGLISIREFHDLQELELASRVVAVIEEHLARNSGGFWIETPAERSRALIRSQPFVEKDGSKELLFVAGPPLKKLASEVDRGVSGAELYIGLRSAGFVNDRIPVPGRGTTRSYWKGLAGGFQTATPPMLAGEIQEEQEAING